MLLCWLVCFNIAIIGFLIASYLFSLDCLSLPCWVNSSLYTIVIMPSQYASWCSCLTAVLSLGSNPPPPASLSSVATVSFANTHPINMVAALNSSTSASTTPLPLPSHSTTTETLDAGLLLSPASGVIPKKLVDKIRSGRFIEMKELLQDNISLTAQLEELQGPSILQVMGATRPRLREVSSLSTWCFCFLGYVATMTSDPITRDQLAYARLLIQQARAQGGLSFLDYDRAFRQQLATDPSLRWNAVNPSLLASTTLGHRSTGTHTFCTLCRASDHTRTQCALAYLEPTQTTSVPAAPQRNSSQGAPRRPRNFPVCFSWNKGPCPYGNKCKYQHVCSSCSAPAHKAIDCPQAVTAPSSSDHSSGTGTNRA